jgi:hypothetical protein
MNSNSTVKLSENLTWPSLHVWNLFGVTGHDSWTACLNLFRTGLSHVTPPSKLIKLVQYFKLGYRFLQQLYAEIYRCLRGTSVWVHVAPLSAFCVAESRPTNSRYTRSEILNMPPTFEQESYNGRAPEVGLLTVPVVDGCTGPVTRVRIPSRALIFAEPLRYRCGVAQPVTTRWLTAVYGRHTGKYLSSTRRAIYS